MPTARHKALIDQMFRVATGGQPPRRAQDRYSHQIADILDLAPAMDDAHTPRVSAEAGLGKGLGYLIPLALRAVRHNETYIVSTYSIKLLRQLIDVEMPKVAKAIKTVTDQQIDYGQKLGRGQFVDAVRINDVIKRLQTRLDSLNAMAAPARADALRDDIDMMQQWYLYAVDPASRGLIVEAMNDLEPALTLPSTIAVEDICLTATSDPQTPWAAKYRAQLDDIAAGARILFVTHASMIIDAFQDGKLLVVPEGARGIVFDEAERAIDMAVSMSTYRQILPDLVGILQANPHVPAVMLTEVAVTARRLLDSVQSGQQPKALLIERNDPAHQGFLTEVKALVDAVEALPSGQAQDLTEIMGLRRWLDAAEAGPVDGQRPLFRASLEPMAANPSATEYTPAFVATSRSPARVLSRLWRKGNKNAPHVDFVLFTSATVTPPMAMELGAKNHPLDADFVVTYKYGDLRFHLAGDVASPFVRTNTVTPMLDPKWIKFVVTHTNMARRAASPNAHTDNRTLVLCPSYQECRLLGEQLSPTPSPPLIHQPGLSLDGLLAQFRADPHGCLLTPSAWEGVDWPDLIDQLVIPRVPFEPPNPTGNALKQEAWARTGRPSASYVGYLALERAMIRLKQGLGRPIRTAYWAANVWILDPRMPVHEKIRRNPLLRNVVSPLAIAMLSSAVPKRFSTGIGSPYEKAVILSEHYQSERGG